MEPTMRKKLFCACKVINNLYNEDKIDYDGKKPYYVIELFLDAIEEIDDNEGIDGKLQINRVPQKIIDLYYILIDNEDERTIELNRDQKPLYCKKGRGRKRKYQDLIDQNDPDIYDPQSERMKIAKRPLGRKLDI